MRARKASIAATLYVIVAALPVAQPAQAQNAGSAEITWPRLAAPELGDATLSHAAGEEDAAQDARTRAVAGFASLLVTGAGQFYKGERLKGTLMFTTMAAAVTYAFTAGIGDGEICTGPDGFRHCTTASHQLNNRFFIGFGTAAAVHAWSVLDAFGGRR